MKILHLQTELNLTCGITKTISQIVQNTSDEFEHFILSLSGDGLSRFSSMKNRPITLNFSRTNLFESFKILIYCIKFIRKNSIQIVHSHHRYFDFIIFIAKKFLKIKTVTSVQSKVYGYKALSYKADKLIACSNCIKQHLIMTYKISSDRIKVIYNSVDSSEISFNENEEILLKQLNISPNRKIIGFIGRLNFSEKGIDILLQAFQELSETRSDIHLLLVGNGTDFESINHFIFNHKLKVTTIGAQQDIFNYINIVDVLILPSRIDPFPLIMLEAGLLKKPFIGSDVDGIPELIIDEENGLLFESENVEDLKNKIMSIVDDPEFADRLAKRLHEKVLSTFTVEKNIPYYEQVYRDVVK